MCATVSHRFCWSLYVAQNLHSWFNNKARIAPTKVNINLFHFKQLKKPKLRHDFQAYSRLYYKDRIKVRADQAWDDTIAAYESNETQIKPHSLTIRQAMTKALFESESQAVKDEVKEYWQCWNEAIAKGRDPEIDNEKGEDGLDSVEDEEAKLERQHVATLQGYVE